MAHLQLTLLCIVAGTALALGHHIRLQWTSKDSRIYFCLVTVGCLLQVRHDRVAYASACVSTGQVEVVTHVCVCVRTEKGREWGWSLDVTLGTQGQVKIKNC
jgi:hypothetical protein